MLFLDENPHDGVLHCLVSDIVARPTPAMNPLPCDRWIARSAFQKAIRRGERAIAIRALANLYEYDRRVVWRHLIVVALEDIGAANVELLTSIAFAQANRKWRASVGGDWAVMAELTRQLAESDHCQATCDLLLRATNDPAFQYFREVAIEEEMSDLMARLADINRPLIERGVIALAAGGGLAEGQTNRDAAAVFETLADSGYDRAIIVVCRVAWKVSRNPMALLLPIIWKARSQATCGAIADDPIPIVQLTSQIPGYALDQFTRRGNAISRALLHENADLRQLLDAAGICSGLHSSTVGDLIFLREGGLVRRRLEWPVAAKLRQPVRWLPAVPRLGPYLGQSLRLIDAKASQIDQLRRRYLSTELR